MKQDLRSFVEGYERAHPDGFVRVTEPVSLEFDIQAVALELQRRQWAPVLLFENVIGHDIPVISNVMASRRALAFGLGVEEAQLPLEYSRRLKEYVKPVGVTDPPFRQTVLTGDQVDLSRLPIPTYYPADAGRYITAALTVARDPDTGVETEGYHRFQLKGRDRMAVSLASRRRMFDYQRRAEARGRNLECAIVLGVHPAVGMGSLAYPPPEISKFDVVGGLFGEPLQVAPCETIDLRVPAWAEIVIEGEILANVREKEGPFGEFTGYLTGRSTNHLFVARAICLRERPWFQSISGGRTPDHVLPLGVLREAEIRNAVSRVIPNVKAVHVPISGCSAFVAFVSIRQTRPGEAKHAIPVVFGADHYVKFVVIVDEDIDVSNEAEVFWALATRVQADRDIVVMSGCLGSVVDPSTTEQGVTAKIGIDATKPFGQPFSEPLRMPSEKMAWARELVERLAT